MALLNSVCGTFENFYFNLVVKSVTKCTKLNSNALLALANEIKIHPNPAQDYLTIENESANALRFKIVSTLGKILLQGDLPQGAKTIDLSLFSANVYFIQTPYNSIKFVKTN